MNILVILVYSFLSIFAGVRVVLSLFSYNSVGGNIIPLDFLVRRKNHTFSETLEHYKKSEYSVQLLFGHFVDFQDQNIMTSYSTVSHFFFPKCDILYINRKIIKY